MHPATERAIVRWIHILFGLMMVAYIYAPPAEVEQYAHLFRYIFVPVVIVTGLWLWQGYRVRLLFAKPPVQEAAGKA